MKLLFVLSLVIGCVYAQADPSLVVTHNDLAYCQRMAWMPGATPFCRQGVWVYSTGNSPNAAAVKVTVDYIDKAGQRRSVEQLVKAEQGNALALFYDLPDIKILRVLAEPLGVAGKSSMKEF